MQEIQYIEPCSVHDEMLRLRMRNKWTFWKASPVWTGE